MTRSLMLLWERAMRRDTQLPPEHTAQGNRLSTVNDFHSTSNRGKEQGYSVM